MQKPLPETYSPTTRQEWRQWLKTNHKSKQSIWIILYKKESAKPTIGWSEAVDEALCFGWIDSKRITVDQEKFMQFFCKRKSKGTWSKINKVKIQELIDKGLMTKAGLEIIEAAKQNWYSNSVFIFCADHWAQPDIKNIKVDAVNSFRIPVFIFEPGREQKVRISTPVSQLDIVNTILHFSNFQDSMISYGINLTDTLLQPNRIVYNKISNAVYQAINDEYVLGFDAIEGKALYYYAYKKDPEKKNNLIGSSTSIVVDSMILQLKAFLQTASLHYRNKTNL